MIGRGGGRDEGEGAVISGERRKREERESDQVYIHVHVVVSHVGISCK